MPACDQILFTFAMTRFTSASIRVVCMAGMVFDCTRCTRTGRVITGTVSAGAQSLGKLSDHT